MIDETKVKPLLEFKKICKKLGINSMGMSVKDMAAAIDEVLNGGEGKNEAGSDAGNPRETSRDECLEASRDGQAFPESGPVDPA